MLVLKSTINFSPGFSPVQSLTLHGENICDGGHAGPPYNAGEFTGMSAICFPGPHALSHAPQGLGVYWHAIGLRELVNCAISVCLLSMTVNPLDDVKSSEKGGEVESADTLDLMLLIVRLSAVSNVTFNTAPDP